jgi:hypothetical protein
MAAEEEKDEESLLNLLAKLWMGDYNPAHDYHEIDKKLEYLESDNTSTQEKYTELMKIDVELDNGYNPLFYAVLLLPNKDPEDSWLGRIIRIAESIETDIDPDLISTLFTAKDHEDKTILMLLLEKERDDSKPGEPIRLNYIQFLLQKYREVNLETQIEEAQKFCNDEGIYLTLNTMGGFRKRRKSKRKKSKSRKSRKYKKKSF